MYTQISFWSCFDMILTGKAIIDEVKSGNIVIDPFCLDMVNPNSYNYRLGNTIYKIRTDILDPKKPAIYEEISIPSEGYVLEPHTLYLGSTAEVIGSSKYAMQLIGRSSVGRLGLFLQITAPLGHVGTSHCWTLELTVVQPLRVYAGMKIGQVSFWTVQGNNVILYNSQYWKYLEPHISEFYHEFEGEK